MSHCSACFPAKLLPRRLRIRACVFHLGCPSWITAFVHPFTSWQARNGANCGTWRLTTLKTPSLSIDPYAYEIALLEMYVVSVAQESPHSPNHRFSSVRHSELHLSALTSPCGQQLGPQRSTPRVSWASPVELPVSALFWSSRPHSSSL